MEWVDLSGLKNKLISGVSPKAADGIVAVFEQAQNLAFKYEDLFRKYRRLSVKNRALKKQLELIRKQAHTASR